MGSPQTNSSHSRSKTKAKGFEWLALTNKSNVEEIQLQLNFDQPDHISKDEYDKLLVTFCKLEHVEPLSATIPSQMSEQDYENIK